MAPVVVVGGGIVGVAAAHSLARAGLDVVVCERSSLGAGSTGRALGGIRAQFSTPENVALSRRAMSVWADFEERFGVDIGFRRHGYLFLTREAGVAREFERTVAMQNERGVPSERIDPAEAEAHLPELRSGAYLAAAYSPEDGTADPHLALRGFARAAREAGVEVRTGVEVTDVALEGGAVAGVDTSEGFEPADAVVNAAGPWGGEVASMAGVPVPVEPTRRQVAVVEPSTPYPEDAPLTVDVDTGVHFAPDRGGDALVAGQFGEADRRDPDPYPSGYDLEWATTALERAADCAGYFGADTRIKGGWSGLYAVTPDRGPIIEEARPGFVNAVGFSGHGFMHAPATAQVVTDVVRTGGTSIVDLERFASDRFEGTTGGGESHVL